MFYKENLVNEVNIKVLILRIVSRTSTIAWHFSNSHTLLPIPYCKIALKRLLKKILYIKGSFLLNMKKISF